MALFTILKLKSLLKIYSLGVNPTISYLVDKRSSERIFIIEDLCPELHVSPSDQVPCFGLEERVLVADGDQLAVALTPLVGHAGQVWVALLAVAADHFAVVVRILSEKR